MASVKQARLHPVHNVSLDQTSNIAAARQSDQQLLTECGEATTLLWICLVTDKHLDSAAFPTATLHCVPMPFLLKNLYNCSQLSTC